MTKLLGARLRGRVITAKDRPLYMKPVQSVSETTDNSNCSYRLSVVIKIITLELTECVSSTPLTLTY